MGLLFAILFFMVLGTMDQDLSEAGETSLTELHDPLLSIPEMVKAREFSRLEFIEGEGGALIPIRFFGRDGRRRPVVLLHGLESHSGWFVQSAKALADLGHPVYAMDRRGSGLSLSPRGDCRDFREMIEDIHTVAELAAERHNARRVHLLGHCFGTLPAAAFAARYPEKVESLILLTPAIYTKTDLFILEKVQVGLGGILPLEQRLPLPLKPEMFSEEEIYQRFVREDPLALKDVTASFYLQIPNIRAFLNHRTDRLTMPMFMGLAGEDPISDNVLNREFFNRVPARNKEVRLYPGARHVLEFSEEKKALFVDLKEWLRRFSH